MIDLNFESILFLIAFVIVLVILYKLFKTVLGALLAGIVGFITPWLLSFVNENIMPLPFEMAPSIETGLQLALLAVVLYLVYSLLKAGKSIMGTVFSPLKKIFGSKK